MANLAKLVLICLKPRFRPEIERAPLKKTYQILNIKLLVCLGLCLWLENERAPPEKTYQILNIKLLVCLRLCLRSKNEICVHIIYDLWSRARSKQWLDDMNYDKYNNVIRQRRVYVYGQC